MVGWWPAAVRKATKCSPVFELVSLLPMLQSTPGFRANVNLANAEASLFTLVDTMPSFVSYLGTYFSSEPLRDGRLGGGPVLILINSVGRSRGAVVVHRSHLAFAAKKGHCGGKAEPMACSRVSDETRSHRMADACV